MQVRNVAAGDVRGHEACERGAIPGQRGEAAHVVGVVHVGMLRVQADEPLGSVLGGVEVARHVLRIDQFQLRLFGIASEWKPGFEPLQPGDALRVVAGAQARLGAPVQQLLAGFLLVVELVVVADERHPRAARRRQEGDCHGQERWAV